MIRALIFVFLVWINIPIRAQVPDSIYMPNIHNIKLNIAGNQLAYPILRLNSADQLELNFDDLDGGVANYSYTWQLCNADWTKTNLSEFDYIKGFTQNRITNYRNASVAPTKYTHYSVMLPERNSLPSRSGNYLLKVFADGDTSNIVFARRVLVEEEKSATGVQIKQPFDGQLFATHQKLVFTVNLGNVNIMNALQQIKVCILQNNRWDNALTTLKPSFIRQNSLEYNTEEAVFAGGREWRWLDLRSFRLLSDRVARSANNPATTDIYVKPDADRSTQRLVLYADRNGMFFNDISESLNYLWQADYANVHFTFVPAGNMELRKDVVLFGELTNYGMDEKAKMKFNPTKGVYETDILLKNGYYDYAYITRDPETGMAGFEQTEGNFWDTENNYTILVYYRAIGGRTDELIGVSHINSLTGKTGY